MLRIGLRSLRRSSALSRNNVSLEAQATFLASLGSKDEEEEKRSPCQVALRSLTPPWGGFRGLQTSSGDGMGGKADKSVVEMNSILQASPKT